MSTSEERVIALRMALDGVRPELPAPAVENVITVAKAYLNFISPAMLETGVPDPDVKYVHDVVALNEGWNAAIDAILAEGAKYRDDDALSVFSIRTQIKSLRK